MKRTVPLAIAMLLCLMAVPSRSALAQDQSGKAAAGSSLALPKTDDGLPGAGPIRRYDWFQRLWEQRRGGFARRAAEEQGAVVFLGDSITQGFGDDFGGAFKGMKTANRGISGDTTRGVLIRLQEDVLALKPAAVVLLIGTNDLEEGAAPETIAGNLTLILAELKKHNEKLPVVLCQVMPSSETKKRPADKIKQLNQLYAAAVKGDPQVTLIETWTLFAGADGDAKKEEFPDLLHPNQAGYAKWAAALKPIFATLGYWETTPDEFALEPGYVSLFNGRDLTGWTFRDSKSQEVKESFDGKAASSDGRYVAKNGRLIVTTPPVAERVPPANAKKTVPPAANPPFEPRKIAQLWTAREFPKNFTLKLEFRATPNADSGVFLRRPQLQCRDYLVAGPYKQLQHYKPQDWNEMVVVVKDGEAHCTCNGEVLEAALKLPESGPIGLEGDRGQMEYRRIRMMEQ